MSMLVHELATNAVKHGALSLIGGKLLVSWRKELDGSLHLTWDEMDGPPSWLRRRRPASARR